MSRNRALPVPFVLELLEDRGEGITDTMRRRRRLVTIGEPNLVELPYDSDRRGTEVISRDVTKSLSHLLFGGNYRTVGFTIGIGYDKGKHPSEGVIYPVQLYGHRRRPVNK